MFKVSRNHFLWHFGDVQIERDEENVESKISIRNYLLLRETTIIIQEFVANCCSANNFIFFLVPANLKIYKFRIDSAHLSELQIFGLTMETIQFKFVRNVKSVKLSEMEINDDTLVTQNESDTFVITKGEGSDLKSTSIEGITKSIELSYVNAIGKCIEMCSYENCEAKRSDLNKYQIMATNISCYLIINQENSADLYEIHNENSIANRFHTGLREKIQKCSSGGCHALLLNRFGQVYTFGYGNHGELGHGTNSVRILPTKIEFLNLIKIIDIACGFWHSLALTLDYDVYVWGWNNVGQLSTSISIPIGSIVNVPTPLDIDEDIVLINAYRNLTLLFTSIGQCIKFGSVFSMTSEI